MNKLNRPYISQTSIFEKYKNFGRGGDVDRVLVGIQKSYKRVLLVGLV